MTDLYPPFFVALAIGAALIGIGLVVRPGRMVGRVVISIPSTVELARAAAQTLRRKVRVAATIYLVSSAVALVPLGAAVGSSAMGPGNPYRFDLLRYGPPPIFGFMLALAPLGGGIVATLFVLLLPGMRWTEVGTIRTADLIVRQPDRGLRSALIATVLALVGLALFTVSTAVTASAAPYETFPSSIVVRNGSGTNLGEYPGWSFVAPAVGSGLVLAALALAAIRRVRSAPGVGRLELQVIDEAIRNGLSRFVSLLVLSATGSALGIAVWGVGAATVLVSMFPVTQCRPVAPGGGMCHQIGLAYAQPALAFGVTEISIGAALVAASLAFVIVAVRQSRILVRTESIAETVDA